MFEPVEIEKFIRLRKGFPNAEETRYTYFLFAEKKDSNEFKYYLSDGWNK